MGANGLVGRIFYMSWKGSGFFKRCGYDDVMAIVRGNLWHPPRTEKYNDYSHASK